VNDNVAVIEEEPACVSGSFTVKHPGTFFFKEVLDFFINRPKLPVAFAAADDEVISETADFTDIE
jgi:hypothetical protein